MRTIAISLSFQRQAGLLPSGDAAPQLIHLAELVLLQHTQCTSRTRTGATTDNHRLVLEPGDLREAFIQFRERYVLRMGNMAAGILARVAHIEHQRVTVD